MEVDRKFCVAPMMNWTDRFCRYFLRLISRHCVLYTEMVSTGAIIYGNHDRHLGGSDEENPVALQLGGNVPDELVKACKIAKDYHYSEINLNCGCPSERVQNARFGAVMMLDAATTSDCISAMRDAVDLPVTVKHRIGVDECDSYGFVRDFVGTVSQSGCTVFIIHARKAWLKGLSPKQNREKPELDYERVYKLKNDFPDLEIIINGGISDIDQSLNHLKHINGVMVGREAYTNPYLLAMVDRDIYGSDNDPKTRLQIANEFVRYVERELATGVKLHRMTRHMLGLFHGMPRARFFRRHLSENAYKPDADISVLIRALEKTGDWLA